jgi:integrase
VPQPIRIWLVLAAWCGLRCKEIALLRRECLIEGASPPILMILPDATKGRGRGRAVPLCDFAIDELRAAAAEMARAGFLWRRPDGRPYTPGQVSHLIACALRELDVIATAHMARHWFGTECYRAKRDLRGVQELMGHADPATTALYTLVVQAETHEIVQALPVLAAA